MQKRSCIAQMKYHSPLGSCQPCSQALAQLLVACNKVKCKRREAGRGPGNEARLMLLHLLLATSEFTHYLLLGMHLMGCELEHYVHTCSCFEEECIQLFYRRCLTRFIPSTLVVSPISVSNSSCSVVHNYIVFKNDFASWPAGDPCGRTRVWFNQLLLHLQHASQYNWPALLILRSGSVVIKVLQMKILQHNLLNFMSSEQDTDTMNTNCSS